MRPVISFNIPVKPQRQEIAESIISKFSDDDPEDQDEGEEEEEEEEAFEPNQDYGKASFSMKAYLGLMAAYIAAVKTPILALKYLVGRGNPELTFKNAWKRMVNTTLFNDLSLSTLRHLTRPASYHQDLITSSPRYAPAKSRLFQPVSVNKGEESFKGYWIVSAAPHRRGGAPVSIDPAEADLVLLYLHGGGYVLFTPQHMSLFLMRLSTHVLSRGFSIAIFALDYSLSPDVKLPTQLRQAAAAYAYLNDTLDISAANLGILGDSAGGNLALSLLSHLHTPHPDIPTHNSPRPSWTWLISPMVTTHPTSSPIAGSWMRNKNKDAFSALDLAYIKRIIAPPTASDPTTGYINFTPNSKMPWKEVLPPAMYVWAGGNECMLDDIQMWTKEAHAAGANVDLHVAEGMGHGRPVSETMPDSAAWREKEVREFLETRIQVDVGKEILPGAVGIAEKIVEYLEESEMDC